LRALNRLAWRELSTAIGGIGEFEAAIAGRAFGALRVASRAFPPLTVGAWPARKAHATISRAVFAAIRGSTTLVGGVGGVVLGAINGLIGDELERQGSELQQPMSVRVAGHPVRMRAGDVAAAFPEPKPHQVVFLHGLMETELAWWLGARRTGQTYGSMLAGDLGATPVYIRYNSGRHVSENGRSLAELLEELLEAWPLPVEEIALIGHSMGGLVARSACHQAGELGHRWVDRVRHVVSLGSPHMGAPLAQGVHYASAALGAIAETRPLGNVLRRRSGGIRDLRQGSLVDEDWRDCDPDALRAVACREIPLLDGATHCFVAATVTRNAKHPVGRLIGDCLVLEPSASGRSRTRRLPFQAEHGMRIGGTHHLALLNHPAVYARLREWLSRPPSRPALTAG
jgi:pimeloyl-ACP methyl ester carboxylesterase